MSNGSLARFFAGLLVDTEGQHMPKRYQTILKRSGRQTMINQYKTFGEMQHKQSWDDTVAY